MMDVGNNIKKIEVKDIKDMFKERNRNTNKGDYGTVGIMGGSLEYSGAIKLANMSAVAVRSGCGIVRVIVPKDIATAITPYLLEQTLYPLDCNSKNHMIMSDEEIEKATYKLNALAIGMGWGRDQEYINILKKLINIFSNPIVIDADGLNTLAQMDLNILKNAKNKIILTPHLKEFERLSKKSIEQIKQDKIEISKEFAKTYNVILLLKGEETIITDGNTVYVEDRGCAGMATAGSGDVLSGILVGLLGYQSPNILTIAGGAFLAGVAGELAQKEFTDISMKASDTIKYIPKAIKYIRGQIYTRSN